jgi:hypothetical protein
MMNMISLLQVIAHVFSPLLNQSYSPLNVNLTLKLDIEYFDVAFRIDHL